MSLVLPLARLGRDDVAVAGGKGANLGELVRAGLPVPRGFVLSTAAYERFVDEAGLREAILAAAAGVSAEDPAAAEAASASIEALVLGAEMPADLRDELLAAYVELAGPDGAVSVRSSATAEDLPGASFAGQQETFLNVRGAEALAASVMGCWASLWTARAMTYRLRQGIPPEDVSLAVVVQRMVEAEVSGIAFTADPSTGARDEILVDASYGLGEAIVGGHVTPDSYRVARATGALREVVLGGKETRVDPLAEGGVTTLSVPEEQRTVAVLDEAALRELARTCVDIEARFGMPQDVEWARADGRLWILQARPITHLPPAPPEDVDWAPPSPGVRLIRRQVVENMPGPLSPLFDALYLSYGLDDTMEGLIEDFGRFDIDALVERPMFLTVNGYAYSRANYHFSLKVVAQIIPVYGRMLRGLLRDSIPRWRERKLPAYQAEIAAQAALDRAAASDEALWAGIRALARADAAYWYEVSILLGLSKVTDGLLDRFLRRLGGERGLSSGRFLRGFPSKTLEAQADLEAIADLVRAEPGLRDALLAAPAAEIPERLDADPVGAEPAAALAAHLRAYGHQSYTLDFAEPTQGEDPLPVLVGLRALVAEPADSAARREALATERDALVEETAASLGPLRRRLFRLLLGWAQRYAPYREEALFYMGAAWPTLRGLAAELGGRLAAAGTLAAADDLYFLWPEEVETALQARAAGEAPSDLRATAGERRALREARRRLSPPAKIPDEPFRLGPISMSIFETQSTREDEGGDLEGFAVSPGRVTAPAAVVLSTADFEKMAPGRILVCPTTTPAWTPLFSQAAGLVTEIGGVLAHGSIVAREYGIPAVMGVQGITRRVRDGQEITVDGDRGRVRLDERAAGQGASTEGANAGRAASDGATATEEDAP